MNADDARREEIARAGERIEDFLSGLTQEDLARQSACEGWTVGDVVGHLIERGEPLPDQIERGLAGDLSPTPGFTDDPPVSEDQFRLDLDRRAVELRQELGEGLLAEFARVNGEFNRVLALVQPDDWDKLCYHRLRPETVRSKADIRIAELAMHEWDMRWALDPDAVLAEDSLPGLVYASGRAVRRAFRADPSREKGYTIQVYPWCPKSLSGRCCAGSRSGELRDRGRCRAGCDFRLQPCHLCDGNFRQVEVARCHCGRQIDRRES